MPLAIVLGAGYGFFMGWYAVANHDPAGYMQLVASVVKIPALFLLTLVVTFPSLYVFNALVGCRLSFLATQRLLVGAIVVNVAVAASLGPILGFFTVSTTSYSFMVLLNVVLMSVAGFVGLAFLLHTLRRLASPWSWSARKRTETMGTADSEAESDDDQNSPRLPGPLEQLEELPEQALGQARTIFKIWVILYGLVGAQMGWLLRPFIGCPDMEFTWFRERSGNFFQAVLQQLQNLLEMS